jgi:hypothetical protein
MLLFFINEFVRKFKNKDGKFMAEVFYNILLYIFGGYL